MKLMLLPLLGLLCLAGTIHAAAPDPLTNLAQRYSYALGMQLAARLAEATKAMTNLFDAAACSRALADNVMRRPYVMTDQDAANVLVEAIAEYNRVEGDAFRAANGKLPGVVTTKSGLQYKVMRPGSGPTPKPTDTVTVHYRGLLVDGTEFENSYRQGQPAVFTLSGPNAVIDGCAEALQLMAPGSIFRVVVPPQLGYGTAGAVHTIGPNATLIYEIELLKIGP
jgi:FKBP-type peptidyl-prolyl cis-trans isomerase FklB